MDHPLRRRATSSGVGDYQMLSLGLFLIAMLSSCALAPASPPPTHTYLLAPDLPQPTSPAPSGPTLLISVPRAVPGYDTRRMAYTHRPYELNYFARNEWVAPPALMLQPIFIRAFEASGHFQSVVPDDLRVLADLRLDTQILRLVQDFSVQPSQGHIVLQARLINIANGREVANRIFEAREPAPEEEPYGGVVALNRALEHILREMVTFFTQLGLILK